MSKILITGASGFLGSYILASFQERGYEVFGTSTNGATDRLKLCDIEDSSNVQAVFESVRPDAVIHCAAISSVTSSPSEMYYKTNVVGTENVLKAAVTSGTQRFVHLSTAGVYGNQDTELLDESLCPKPVHHYGMSKFCSERVVMNYKEDIAVSIVRPFNIIGPGQNKEFIVPKLVSAFKRRSNNVKLGNIDVFRDYVDVRDCVNFIHEIMVSQSSDTGILNLCTGKPVSLRELIAHLQEITGHNINISVAAGLVRKNEVWKLLGNPQKLIKVMGGKLDTIPLQETLKHMLQSEVG